MSNKSTFLIFAGGATFLLVLTFFMVRMVSQWEVAEAEQAARLEAARIATDAVAPALQSVEAAAARASDAAEQAATAAGRAEAVARDATAAAAAEITRQMTEEAVRAVTREQARLADEETARLELARVRERAANATYLEAQWDPLHFSPAIDRARDEQCLVCHAEVLERKVSAESPAGVVAADSLAWYQTLDTYAGAQQTFHQRHLTSDFASAVMDLSCNSCHRGNDPREEAAMTRFEQGRTQLAATGRDGDLPAFTLRKMVNPSDTCLRCHGSFPAELMGLPGPWHEIRQDFEFAENENGCLTCHTDLFRTVRHQVTYLQPDRIEALAQTSSDVCYGCHGGRAWYRNSFAYPRHPWPGMPEEAPEWALGRPIDSDPRFRIDAP